MMIYEQKKEQALSYINQERLLKQVRQVEATRLDKLIDNALNMPQEVGHWQAYEILKREAMAFVGFEAKCEAVATPAHYSLMLTFIDWLLTEKRPLAIEMSRDQESEEDYW